MGINSICQRKNASEASAETKQKAENSRAYEQAKQNGKRLRRRAIGNQSIRKQQRNKIIDIVSPSIDLTSREDRYCRLLSTSLGASANKTPYSVPGAPRHPQTLSEHPYKS